MGNRTTLKNSKSDWIVVEQRHEPLVTTEEFQAAQDNLAEFMEKESVLFDTHLFTGKMRCGHCGYAMPRRSAPTPQFFCNTKSKTSGLGCMEGNIKEYEIASVVLSAIHIYIKVLLDEKDLLIKAGSNDRMAKLQKQIAVYQSSCNGISEQKAELYDAMAEEKISREQYRHQREKLSREQADMERQANRLEAELAELQGKLAAAKQGEPKLLQYLKADTLTRQMVVDFVDCIYVYNDRSIHIDWTFGDKGEGHRQK